MKRRFMMMATFMQLLTGCAAQAMGSIRGGENASYGATNVSRKELEQLRLVDAISPDRWYFSQSGQPADTWRPSAEYPKRKSAGYGGNQYFADTGHKIPDEVLISWREMPALGGQPYTGELKGPYRVKVRPRIPVEVLKQARRDGMVVEMGFTSGELPIVFQWRLVDTNKRSDSKGKISPLAEGGDTFP